MGAGSWGFMLKFKSGRRSTIQWCFVAKAAAMVGQNQAVLPAAMRELIRRWRARRPAQLADVD